MWIFNVLWVVEFHICLDVIPPYLCPKKLPVHLIAECDNDLSISYLNNMKCQDVSSVMDYFDCQVCFQFDFFHCYYFLWKSGRSWFGDFFFRKLLHCLFVSGVFFNVETV